MIGIRPCAPGTGAPVNTPQPPKLSREEIEALLDGPPSPRLEVAALSAAVHADDLLWAEEVCSRLAGHPDARVRGNAIAAFAHLARRFHNLSFIAQAIVQSSQRDPEPYVREQAAATLEELKRNLRNAGR